MGLLKDWFGISGPAEAIDDWWKKNAWWVYCIAALIVAVLVAYVWRAFR